MTTDEQLIEQIRTAFDEEVAGVHPSSDVLARMRAARGGRDAPPQRSSPRARGLLAGLVSIAVVALVAVTFISLGHRHASSTGSPGLASGSRQLVARIAALRRPQGPADHLPAVVSAQLQAAPKGILPFSFVIVPSLTRFATTITAGDGPLASVDIYLVVGRAAGYPADVATTVAVAGPADHRYLLGIPEVVDEQTAIATGGLTTSAVGSAGSPEGTRGVNAGVVPDGVTRVRWVFPQAQGRSVTVYPKVQGNVAVAKATGVGVSSATWYGAGGDVIASDNQSASRLARLKQLTLLQVPQPAHWTIAASLRRHFAAFSLPAAQRHPASGTLLPAWIARAARLDQQFRLDPIDAVQAPQLGDRFWVLPGADSVCLEHLNTNQPGVSVSGGCATASGADAGNLIAWNVDQTTHTVTVWGLAPDTNTTVTVTLANGSSRTIPVNNDMYGITLRPGPTMYRAVTLRDAAGRLRTYTGPPATRLSAAATRLTTLP